jgi:hypothetical protein
VAEAIITSVLEGALKQASERIARKLTEGKRLTDTEVIILLLDQMNRRMEIMNESLNRRIDDTNRRISESKGFGVVGINLLIFMQRGDKPFRSALNNSH